MRRLAVVVAVLVGTGALVSTLAWAYFSAKKTSPQPISVATIAPPVDIRYESSSSVAVDANRVTVPKPAGVQPGWVMVATVGTLQLSSMPPAGWTAIGGTVNSPSLLQQRSFYRVAGATEPASYTFTFSGTNKATAGIVAYSGVRAANPIEASAGASGKSATATAPTVTASYKTRRIVAVTSAKPEPLTITGATKVWEKDNGSTKGAGGDAAQAPGPSGATTVTLGQDEWTIQTIVLNGGP